MCVCVYIYIGDCYNRKPTSGCSADADEGRGVCRCGLGDYGDMG